MENGSVNFTEYVAFMEKLRAHVSASRSAKGSFVLMILYVQHLSRDNETLGYNVNRKLTSEIAVRLLERIRATDEILCVGERKFVIMIPSVINEGHAILAATKIAGIINQPFELDDNNLDVGVSIGISFCPEHALEAELLLQRAEIALQSAKECNKPFEIFSPSSAEHVADQWRLENEIDQALENQEFELYYQPKISLANGEPLGAEALMRWNCKKRGMIAPDVFIPLADRSGKIKSLTWFALETALRQLAEWPTLWGPLSVSVNITSNIVKDFEIVNVVKDMIERGGEQKGLILEVTENALMSDPDTSFKVLHELKKLNIQISIDDFGTGYSSLSHFKNIPADELKVDKSFIFSMKNDPADASIVRTVIDLAHSFDLLVVAEGIEDEGTSISLAKLKCDYAQGYYYSKPLPHAEFVEWLNNYIPV